MEHSDNTVVVPFDFTKAAYQALEYGVMIARARNQQLMLLNIVSKEKERAIAEKRLFFVAQECFINFQLKPDILVRRGTPPYTVIKAVAKEFHPAFMVLKYSETGGLKVYPGIRTIKILAASVIPFLVIHEGPLYKAFTRLLFPMDFKTEEEFNLKRIAYFATFYPRANMYIMMPKGKSAVPQDRIDEMMEMMEEKQIKVSFLVHSEKKNTAEKILETAQHILADIIITSIEDTSSFNKFLFGFREEKLIANSAKIPVLCINSNSSIL